jgi:hypothetical protein
MINGSCHKLNHFEVRSESVTQTQRTHNTHWFHDMRGHVAPPPNQQMQIFVKRDSYVSLICLDVERSDTVETVKMILQGADKDFEVEKQHLTLAGVELKEDKTLAFYNIQPNSILGVEHGVYIFVRLGGNLKLVTMGVCLSITVDALAQMLRNKHGIMTNKLWFRQCILDGQKR